MLTFNNGMIQSHAGHMDTGRSKLSFNTEQVIMQNKGPAQIQMLNSTAKLNFTNSSTIRSGLIDKVYKNSITQTHNDINIQNNANMFAFENRYDVSSEALTSLNKYNFVFKNALTEIVDKYRNSDDANKDVYASLAVTANVPSLFNPYISLSINGMAQNIPLNNTVYDKRTGSITETLLQGDDKNITFGYNPNANITDCSTSTLCELSRITTTNKGTKISPMGMERYALSDFLYCKDWQKIPNNMMITLRRFAHPVGDNIMANANVDDLSPDMGRMICWLGEDNKLEDILKYSYKATWKEFNAAIEEKQSEEGSEERGIMGSIVNLANPAFRDYASRGHDVSGNILINKLCGRFPSLLSPNGHVPDLGHYDEHKIYTPHDTIQSTHKYEGKLEFSHDFTLVFKYEMRAYQDINPRAAMLDLLANIQQVTYRRGHFWGGASVLAGTPGNPRGWRQANAILDNAWDKLGGFMEGLMTGNVDWASTWGSISSALGKAGELVSQAFGTAKSLINNVINNDNRTEAQKTEDEAKGKQVVNYIKRSGAPALLKGLLKNKLGRPAVYAFNSLLSGTPVGPWHVTIGNPRNPILSMGNMIVESSDIQHYGPLGIDDFPTGIKVTVKLKHATPRDAVNIQKMYTGGGSAIGFPIPGVGKLEKYVNMGTVGTEKVELNDPNSQLTEKEVEGGNKVITDSGTTITVDRETNFDNTEALNYYGTQMYAQIAVNAAANLKSHGISPTKNGAPETTPAIA